MADRTDLPHPWITKDSPTGSFVARGPRGRGEGFKNLAEGERVEFDVVNEPQGGKVVRAMDLFRAQEAGISLQELHDPETGRLDAARFAEYLKVPLRQLADAMGKNYSTVHKTPASPAVQVFLGSVKRTLEILEQVLPNRPAVLAWLNSRHADLGNRTPLGVILAGYADAVEDMLEAALVGDPA